MTFVPWIIALVLGMAGGIGLWYYRNMYLAVQKNLAAADLVVSQWAVKFTEQAGKLAAARTALEDRQKAEVKSDQETISHTDAAGIVDLLNGLHPRKASPGSGS